MRALLDINVLIALQDPDHVFHEGVHTWWARNLKQGWASCPLTENGVVRIMSNPGYSRSIRLTPGELISRLRQFASPTDHEFWPDDLSLRKNRVFRASHIYGSKQLTDIYLLALAVEHDGRLVTFDQSIASSAVKKATSANLCVI